MSRNDILERVMVDAIASRPEFYLGEPGLRLVERQYRIGRFRLDLLFEDRHNAKLNVEIQEARWTAYTGSKFWTIESITDGNALTGTSI